MEARPDLFGGRRPDRPDLGGRLAEWAAAARADQAAEARSREGFLRRIAAEGGTFAGVLVDLAERGDPVLVVTASARRHRGVVRAVGTDFAALRTDAGREVLVAFDGIAVVRADAGPASTGDRAVVVAIGLAEALTLLAEERPRVLATAAGEGMAGVLATVGQDMATIVLDGADGRDGRLAYVAVAMLDEVALA